MKKLYSKIKTFTVLASALMSPIGLSSQISYTFTPCGATGISGPSQAQANTAYTLTNLSGSVTVSGGIQQFTVPVTGAYRIAAIGARGGYNGGRGAYIAGDFTLTAGTVLKILVGQQGSQLTNGSYIAGGGGGGSFITSNLNVPYIVAGGGGGNGDGYTGTAVTPTTPNMQAALVNNGFPFPGGANGGTGGNGGTCGVAGAGGGAGISGNGLMCNSSSAALSFINGGTGGNGSTSGNGGFGGGGGGYSSGVGNRGGGGGGYSGGGGGDTPNFNEANAPGGGGGSYNNGANQTNSLVTTSGDGMVIISELCNISLTSAGSSSSLAPVICSGTTLTLTTNGVSNYNWSDGNTTSSVIVVTPTVTTTYTVSAMSVSACIANAAITVTVSPGIPTITINASSTNTCLGTSITLTASGALTYTWTGGVTNAVPFVPTSTSGYTVTGANGCGSSTAATAVTLSPLPMTVVVTPTLVCAGNVASIIVNAAANSYTWLPINATGASSTLVVGPTANTIYTVVASNGTCSGTGTVALATVQVPTITLVTNTTSICVGNSVTLTASGGNNYTWTPGSQNGSVITVNPTTPTLYSVIGDNTSGCFGSASQGIVVNPLPVISITASEPMICNGSSVTFTASGNSNSYSWSSGGTTGIEVVSPTANSVYTVTGTNTVTQCQNTQTIDIAVYSPTISITGNTTICSGNAANLTATGANNYTWSSGSQLATESVTPNITSTYSVSAITVTNNLFCPGTASVQVVVNPNPTITASSERAEICKSESVNLSAGGALTYLWSNAQTTPTITITSSVITTVFYTVTGTNSQGCSDSKVVQVKISGCIGVDEVENEASGFSVFPNPSKGELTLKGIEAVDVKVLNSLGQLMRIIKLTAENVYTVDISGLSNGLYYFITQTRTGYTSHRVIVSK